MLMFYIQKWAIHQFRTWPSWLNDRSGFVVWPKIHVNWAELDLSSVFSADSWFSAVATTPSRYLWPRSAAQSRGSQKQLVYIYLSIYPNWVKVSKCYSEWGAHWSSAYLYAMPTNFPLDLHTSIRCWYHHSPKFTVHRGRNQKSAIFWHFSCYFVVVESSFYPPPISELWRKQKKSLIFNSLQLQSN